MQRVRKRTDAHLGDEPEQIGGKSHVGRLGPDCVLVAREGGAQQRSRVDPATRERLADMEGHLARAAAGEVVTQLHNQRAQECQGEGDVFASQHGDTARQLA